MRRLRVGAAVGAAVIVLGGAGLLLANGAAERAGDPALLVERYLDAVASGDEREANRLVEPGQVVGEMMVDGLLAEASERIEVGDVETVSRDESEAAVAAEFSLGGERFSTEFSLSGEPGGFLRPAEWTLNTGLVGSMGIAVRAPAQDLGYEPELRVGGEELPLEGGVDGEWTASFFGYPAVYDVSVSSSDYFEGSEAQATLRPPGEGAGLELWTAVTIEPTDRLASELLDQGAALAQACVDARTLFIPGSDPPTGCPRALDLQAPEACRAAGGAPTAQVDRWTVSCAPSPAIVPFGPTVRSEPAGEELRLEPSGSHDSARHLGPYRFVDADTGAETVEYLSYADLLWDQGRPRLAGGDFHVEQPASR